MWLFRGHTDNISFDSFLADFADCTPAFLVDHQAIRRMSSAHTSFKITLLPARDGYPFYVPGVGVKVVLDHIDSPMSTQPLLQRTAQKRIALPVRVEPKVSDNITSYFGSGSM